MDVHTHKLSNYNRLFLRPTPKEPCDLSKIIRRNYLATTYIIEYTLTQIINYFCQHVRPLAINVCFSPKSLWVGARVPMRDALLILVTDCRDPVQWDSRALRLLPSARDCMVLRLMCCYPRQLRLKFLRLSAEAHQS